jgi:hypothetical protein
MHPPPKMVHGAPTRPATAPATRLPNGAMPMKDIA